MGGFCDRCGKTIGECDANGYLSYTMFEKKLIVDEGTYTLCFDCMYDLKNNWIRNKYNSYYDNSVVF